MEHATIGLVAVAVAGAGTVMAGDMVTLAVLVIVAVPVAADLPEEEEAAVEADPPEEAAATVLVDSTYQSRSTHHIPYVTFALATPEHISTAAVAVSSPAATARAFALFQVSCSYLSPISEEMYAFTMQLHFRKRPMFGLPHTRATVGSSITSWLQSMCFRRYSLC